MISVDQFKLTEDYDLLDSNCVTFSMDGISAGEDATGAKVSELQGVKAETDPRDVYDTLIEGTIIVPSDALSSMTKPDRTDDCQFILVREARPPRCSKKPISR